MAKKSSSKNTKTVKTKSPQSQTTSQKDKLLVELTKVPIIQVACQRVGVGRATFYSWKKEDAEFRKLADKAVNEGRLAITDLAESRLIRNIQDGNNTAIIFWLKNNNERYTDKQFQINVEPRTELSKEEIDDLIRALYFNFSDMTEQNRSMLKNFLGSEVTNEMIDNSVSKAVVDYKDKVTIKSKGIKHDDDRIIDMAKVMKTINERKSGLNKT